MALDTTKKIIIRLSIFGALFCAIVFIVLIPTLNHIKRTAQESYKLRLLLEEKYQESINSRITRKKLDEIKGAVTNFDTFVFKAGQELELITFFESTAAKHNLIQSITSSNLDKIDNSHLALISINLSGSYHDALQYITDLETSNYFISIKQLHLTPVFTKEGNPSPMVSLDISTEIYVTP